MSFVDELEQRLTDGIAVAHRHRTRRRRAAGAGATVAVAALALAGGWALLTTDPPSTQLATEGDDADTGTSTTNPAASNDAATESLSPAPVPGQSADTADGGLDQLQRSLALTGSVTLRMGSELLIWGGGYNDDSGADPESTGVRYDPATDTWRQLPPAPGGPQIAAPAAWTGTEVLICCGRTANGTPGGAVAYDPAADTWRELAPPPLTEAVGAAWFGGRFHVVSQFATAAYDPATNSWEQLASPPADTALSTRSPLVATDAGIVLWPLKPSRSTTNGHRYDPAADTWTELPAPPAEAHPAMADIAWTGDELIVVGGLPAPGVGDSERLVGARLEWATMTWTPLPDVWPEPSPNEGNLGSQAIAWTGDVLIVAASALGSGADPIDGVIASYDPETDEWRRLSAAVDGLGWNATLVPFDDEVLAISIGSLHRISASRTAGEPVGEGGIPAIETPPLTDIGVEGVPLILVGSNGGGAITVLDLNHGVRTTYEAGRHHQLSGSITDMAMSDGWLYVWTTDGPTLRYPANVTSFGLHRLSFGELTQPGDVVQLDGPERFVLPAPSMDLVWSWEVAAVPGGSEAVARLLSIGDDRSGDALVENSVDDRHTPMGVSDDGALVLSGNDSTIALTVDGQEIDMGPGSAVVVAGPKVLVQTCDGGRCVRAWKTVAEPSSLLTGPPDERVWFDVGGPVIPGHSAPLSAASPEGRQVLVGSRPADDSEADVELLRVEVTTMNSQVVPVPGGLTSGALATWSRDGRHVVVVDGNDVVVADTQTGQVDRHPAIVPDGFFILAAG